MRLRQIKLAGFKSFADPTLIELNDPLVAIVGPNGCGKSNIIDAVRWVLGAGRVSELRGSSLMTELIFSGSAGRSPVGRASVELVLDNKDGSLKGPWGQYAEVSVKRVITRDGQSAYYINRQQVRRRDVQEIFLGTGLGARSYAIISQGMISSFIKAKPEELRGYIEEAAGVSLYKERRRETESLLKSTDGNLARAHDMQAVKAEETERLRAEAETAARWKALTVQKEQSESLWYFLQHEEAKKEVDSLRAEAARIEAETLEKKAALEEAAAAREPLEAAVRSADAAHENARNQEREAEKALARLEGEAKRVVEARRSAERALAEALSTLKVKREQREAAAASAEEAAAALEALEASIDEADEENAAREETLAAAEESSEAAQAALAQASEKLVKARTALQVAEAAVTRESARVKELEARSARFDEEERSAERPRPEALEEAKAAAEEAAAASEEAAAASEEADAAAEEAREALEAANAAYFADLSALKEKTARLDALRGVEEAALGSDAFRRWAEDSGVEGLPELADEMTCSPEWTPALEAVLERRTRAYLLRDLRTAAALAKPRPPGRVAFAAPAAGIEGGRAPAASRPQSLRLADGREVPLLLSHIEAKSPAAADALAAWLALVGTAESLAEAMAMRSALPDGALLVTKEGDAVSRASVAFWAQDDPELASFSRRQDIRRLESEAEALENQVAAEDDERRRAVEREASARSEAEGRRRAREEAVRRSSAAEIARREAQAEADAWTRREADRRLSAEELRRELAAKREEVAGLLDEADRCGDAVEAAEAAAGSASAAAERAENRLMTVRREQMTALHAAQMKRLELKQRREQAAAFAKRAEELLADIEREAEREREAREALAAGSDEEAERETAERLREVEALGKAAAAAAEKLEAAKREAEANARISRELQSQMVPLAERLGELRVQAEQKAGLLAQFASRMDELGADWTAMAVLAQARGAKAGAVRAEVTRLMNEIAALGPVNHAALAHLEAAERAMAATAAQIADLEKAKETLEAAIRKIDAETRSRMRETFRQINANFDDTFKGLFGGGRAELVMSGDEILDAGVEVIAQPPGKRNASVKLLSGGEQALTATALVFAMFRLNPAPFCLLDEVDAPLDEANQARLASLCLKMSEATQFLIITHHRVTMEFAAALIGVTMREPGVSRVVSVDIEEAMKYAGTERTA